MAVYFEHFIRSGLGEYSTVLDVFYFYLTYLSKGPFICGRSELSVADHSAYALITFGYEAGLTGGDSLLRKRRIQEWALRVKAKLDTSLSLVPNNIRVRSLGD